MASGLKEPAMIAIADRAARLEGASSLVLRGGLVVRELIAPHRRPVDDVDFLALCSEEEARSLLGAMATSGDEGFSFAMTPIESIWVETEFPGLRTQCDVSGPDGSVRVQIDVGFGDPRAAPETRLQLPGMTTDIAAVAAETMLAWKIHGMFERGDGAWRAKDLIDVLDLSERVTDEALAARCLRLAFHSRGDDFTICERFLREEWGTSRGSRRKWRSFRRKREAFDAVRVFPEDLQDIVAQLRRRLEPLVAAAEQVQDA